jgi:rod shape-determining protein MreC
VLATSGVDGVYPPGLPVARVDKVERRNDSAFARVGLRPLALLEGTAHVMVLQPVSAQIPPRPEPEPVVPAARKGARN